MTGQRQRIRSQIHVADGARIQTFAARETETGLILLVTAGEGDLVGTTEFHIPSAARPWLEKVARGLWPAPNVPHIDVIKRQANEAHDGGARP